MVKFHKGRDGVLWPPYDIGLYARVPGRVLKGKPVMQKQLPHTTNTVFTGPTKPFRYVVLEDKKGRLAGWWDYGSKIQLGDGETLTVEFKDPIVV